jgi:hypothetical protein
MKKTGFCILLVFVVCILFDLSINNIRADMQDFTLLGNEYAIGPDLYEISADESIDKNENNFSISRCSLPEPGTFLFLAMGSIVIIRKRKNRT